MALQVIENLALVPDVVAGGEHIRADFEEFLGDGRRDAEPSGGILGVGDGQVDPVGGDDVLQMVGSDAPPGRCENIPHEKNVHP